MRTSTAEKHGHYCPKCGAGRSRDTAGKGWVKHLNNNKCRFENGMKDGRG